ncbi:IS630 family transposase [Corallococcus exiguus]|nr:IS630 family transposase [Corallococcus exiguus]
MEDVLALYQRPLCPTEPVVCFDERPVQLLEWVRPASPASPGREARRDYAYFRCGTANLFCTVEPKAGWHFVKATPNRKSPAFAEALQDIAKRYPEANTIHLVLDNLSTHSRHALEVRYGVRAGRRLWRRFTPHYTPVHGSWLNQAEVEISLLSRQCLGGGGSPRSTSSAAKRRPGRNGPTATGSGFVGDSPCRRLERSSITNPQTSPGHRTGYPLLLFSAASTQGNREITPTSAQLSFATSSTRW